VKKICQKCAKEYNLKGAVFCSKCGGQLVNPNDFVSQTLKITHRDFAEIMNIIKALLEWKKQRKEKHENIGMALKLIGFSLLYPEKFDRILEERKKD
jgi:dissimilatory sulfite reductase (desulfoviridin) alpha/beta subunit